MRHIKYILATLLFIVFSCSEVHISSKKMPLIIAEIHIAEKYINLNHEILLNNDSTRYFEPIFKKYGYSSKDFKKALSYYLTRPAKLNKIYAKALLILEEKESETDELIYRKAKEDSVLATLNKFADESRKISRMSQIDRAVRWLRVPDLYPDFSQAIGDSLRTFYETPQIAVWWSNNLKKEIVKYSILKRDEKNSRSVHISHELELPDSDGGADPE